MTDPDLVQEGLAFRSAGRRDKALESFKAALDKSPTCYWALVHYGIELRDIGKADEAITKFEAAISFSSELIAAFFEAGFTAFKAQRLEEAQSFFLAGLRIHPASPDLRHGASYVARIRGDYALSKSILEDAGSDLANHPNLLFEYNLCRWHIDEDQSAIHALLDFDPHKLGKFLNESVFHRTMPLDVLQSSSSAHLRSYKHQDYLISDLDSFRTLVLSAAQQARPFSFVRLGDGEGAFLTYTEMLDTAECPLNEVVHAKVLGAEIWNTWVGKSLADEHRSDIARLGRLLRAAIQRADAVGIPKIGNVAGASTYIEYHGLLKSHETARKWHSSGLFVAQIHEQAQRIGLFEEAMRCFQHVVVITCHPSIAQLLSDKMPGCQFSALLIPSQRAHHALFKYEEGDGEEHFPTAFDKTIRAIEERPAGMLYLVAGGVFGKIYCDVVKRCGGVALDIGAVADAIAGFNTRPSIGALIR